MLSTFSLYTSKKGRRFVVSHRLPQEVLDVADTVFTKVICKAIRKNNRKKLLASGFSIRKLKFIDNAVVEHEKLPGWVIKFGNRPSLLFKTISRVRMAENIAKYAQDNNLTSIHLPKKYLYHITHRRHKLIDKNYLVFCEKIIVRPKSEPRIFSQKVINEMLKVINHFAIMDASPGNMGRIDNDNIAMLDTEPTNRGAGGLWHVFDNPLTRVIKRFVGRRVFLNSLDEG